MLIWTNFDSFAITYLSSSLQMIINSKVQMTMAISENIEKKKKIQGQCKRYSQDIGMIVQRICLIKV